MSTDLDQTPPQGDPRDPPQQRRDMATQAIRFERLCVTLGAVLVALWLAWTHLSDPGCQGPNRVRLASSEMGVLLRAIELYQLHNGRSPASLEDLVGDGMLTKLVPDPWGSSYELHTNPERTRWAIRSAGPDRAQGTLDDLYELQIKSSTGATAERGRP
jgi:hypothetical protein